MTGIKIAEIVVSGFAAFGAITTLIAGIAMVKEKVAKKEWFGAVNDGITTFAFVAFLGGVTILFLLLACK